MRVATLSEKDDPEAQSDENLVALARAGAENAIRTLIRRNNRRLFRVARAVVHDDEEAEDIVQEAYVRAFTSLDSFRGEAAFSTWVTRIALNEALGRRRRQRPSVDLAECEEVLVAGEAEAIMFPLTEGTQNPESEAGRAQVRRLLEAAIDRLPEPFRLVFILREIEGLGTDATATLLSIRPETAKTRLFRARRLMRTELERMLLSNLSEVFPFAGKRCAIIAERVIERLRE